MQQSPLQAVTQPDESETAIRDNASTSGLRIVLAIASKDISTAIRNKLVLSILLGTLLVVANGSVLPLLLGLRNTPTAVAYDEGHSTLLRGLTARSDLRLTIVQSREEMEEAVSGAPETRLGLVIPADFDQRAGSGAVVALSGYVAHWADQQKAARYTEFFAQELSRAGWSSVQIHLDQPVLYPDVDTGGQLSITTLMLFVVILTIGMALVPLLFIEEKESQTFEVLLVSPASLVQVLGGKALAGGFYCLAAALLVLLLNQALLVHWGVALLAVLLGAAFTVALGLLVGLLSDTPATTGVWGGILMVALIALTILHSIAQSDWPAFARAVLERLPGAALIELFRLSMVGVVPPGLLWVNAAALALAAGLVFALIYGLLRRADR